MIEYHFHELLFSWIFFVYLIICRIPMKSLQLHFVFENLSHSPVQSVYQQRFSLQPEQLIRLRWLPFYRMPMLMTVRLNRA